MVVIHPRLKYPALARDNKDIHHFDRKLMDVLILPMDVLILTGN